MSVLIRRGSPSDLAQVQRLNQALFKHERDAGFYEGELFNVQWPYEQAGTHYFTACLGSSKSSSLFLATSGREPVCYLAGSSSSKSYLLSNPIAEIENMFVEAEYRDKGIGGQLVQAFIEWARAAGAARLRVGAFAKNSEAIRFYERNAFEPHELILEQSL
ncbi:MAG TPA: GNAT family N-acetyltransferase [Candidatus Saccharimonadia bacterium]|nr:GNAT family N-acetyltransferase [Candidatus Saccharimonadia bacterium]